MCDNLYKVSDALAKQKQNPLNKLCASCYIKSNKEFSVSNELETTNNSKMIIEGDNKKNLKIIILRIVKMFQKKFLVLKNFLFSLVLNFLNYFHLLCEIQQLF